MQFSPPICRPQPSAQPSSLISSGFFSPPISSHSLAPTPSAAVRADLRTHLISRRQPSAQPSSLITSSFFSPPISSHSVAPTPSAAVRAAKLAHLQRLLLPISSHSLAPTPSAAVRAILPTHLPSAAVRAAKLPHHQRLFLPTHFQPLRCTHAVRSHPRSSPHPFPVRSRPRSQARSSPAASSPHPFPTSPLHPRRPQPSAQFSAPICRPQPSAQLITSGFFSPPISSHSVAPTPSAAVHAVLRTHLLSAAVRAAKLAHHQRLLLPTHFQPLRCTHAVRSHPRSSPHPFAVRSRPRSQGRSSPAASSLHPFPATPLHPRRPQPSAQFSAPICRPQPSVQPRSLITSGFFSPSISSHAVALAPSTTVRALLRTHSSSAAVRAAKLAHHQRLLLPTHFQPLPCTQAVRSRPLHSFPFLSHPFPFLSQPFPTFPFLSLPFPSFPFLSLPFPSFPFLSLPFSFLSHPFPSFPFLSLPFPSCPFLSHPFPSFPFSPPISSHSVAPTPSAAIRAVLRTHLPSAAVRAAKVAHHQRLLLPTHFQPPPCTHAVRSRPRSSPHDDLSKNTLKFIFFKESWKKVEILKFKANP